MKRLVSILIIGILIIGGGWLFLKDSSSDRSVSSQETRMVVGGDGKEIQIPSRPQRVVVISSSGLDLYVAAGGLPTLAGVISQYNPNYFQPEQLAEISKIERVGPASGVSLEKIIALKPDLVIGAEIAFQRQLEVPLKQAGIPLLLIRTQSVEDNIQGIRLFGELAGTSDLAEKKITEIQETIQQIQVKKGNRSTPRVLAIFGTPESFVMALPTSFPGNLLELAGAENVAAGLTPMGSGMGGSSYAPFSLEFVLESKPDRIFFITHDDPEEMKKKFTETIAENPAWSSVPALQNGKLAIFPFEMAINPGSQTNRALWHLSDILYSEEP